MTDVQLTFLNPKNVKKRYQKRVSYVEETVKVNKEARSEGPSYIKKTWLHQRALDPLE